MTYKELSNLSYPDLVYAQFLINCIAYKQTPYQAILYNRDKNLKVMEVFKRTSTGNTSTKKMVARNDQMPLLVKRIKQDFPDIEITSYE